MNSLKNRYMMAIFVFFYRISKQSVFDFPIPCFARAYSFDIPIIFEITDVLLNGGRVLMPRMLASWLEVIFELFLISEIILFLFGVSRASFLFPTLFPII